MPFYSLLCGAGCTKPSPPEGGHYIRPSAFPLYLRAVSRDRRPELPFWNHHAAPAKMQKGGKTF
jgi:hypothetical protein